jgi:hypothetical protein
MRAEGPGALASAPVEEPTEAAALHIVLVPDTGSEDSQEKMRGTISASWTRLRSVINLTHAGRGHQ